jgi:hypothetical protein
MTRNDLGRAADRLAQTARGRRALEALRVALPDLLGLDPDNEAAIMTLIRGLPDYPGTVTELLQ